MNVDLKATEFRNFAASHIELQTAIRRDDWRTAKLALEEIEAIEMHTRWGQLRNRCAAVLAAHH